MKSQDGVVKQGSGRIDHVDMPDVVLGRGNWDGMGAPALRAVKTTDRVAKRGAEAAALEPPPMEQQRPMRVSRCQVQRQREEQADSGENQDDAEDEDENITFFQGGGGGG